MFLKQVVNTEKNAIKGYLQMPLLQVSVSPRRAHSSTSWLQSSPVHSEGQVQVKPAPGWLAQVPPLLQGEPKHSSMSSQVSPCLPGGQVQV